MLVQQQQKNISDRKVPVCIAYKSIWRFPILKFSFYKGFRSQTLSWSGEGSPSGLCLFVCCTLDHILTSIFEPSSTSLSLILACRSLISSSTFWILKLHRRILCKFWRIFQIVGKMTFIEFHPASIFQYKALLHSLIMCISIVIIIITITIIIIITTNANAV